MLRSLLRPSVLPSSAHLSSVHPFSVRCAAGLLIAASILVGVTPAGAQNGDLDRFDKALRKLVQKVEPSVVKVTVVAASDGDQEGTAVGAAQRRTLYRSSGIISGANGEITTVIPGGLPEEDLEDGESLRIQIELHDGRMFPAQWRGSDDETGIALLSVRSTSEDLAKLRAVRYAREKPTRGQTVVAIGATGFDLGHIAHPARGISHRLGSFPRGILTSIEARPGDVGGLLANPSGELVGLLAFSVIVSGDEIDDPATGGIVPRGRDRRMGTRATRSESTEGVALGRVVAIPADLLQRILTDLRAHGVLRRGALGATFQFHHPALVGPTHYGAGAMVRELVAGGAAEKDGLLVGDVIQAVDGHELRRAEDLLWFRERVEYGGIESVLRLKVARMEHRRVVSKTLRVQIGARPEGTHGDQVEPPPQPDCPPIPGGKAPTGGEGPKPGGATAPTPRVGPKPPVRPSL